MTERLFLHECDLVKDVSKIGHGPKYLTHVTQKQGPSMPYAQGYLIYW